MHAIQSTRLTSLGSLFELPFSLTYLLKDVSSERSSYKSTCALQSRISTIFCNNYHSGFKLKSLNFIMVSAQYVKIKLSKLIVRISER